MERVHEGCEGHEYCAARVVDVAQLGHAEEIGLRIVRWSATRALRVRCHGRHLLLEGAKPPVERAVRRAVIDLEMLVVEVVELVGLEVVLIARMRRRR